MKKWGGGSGKPIEKLELARTVLADSAPHQRFRLRVRSASDRAYLMAHFFLARTGEDARATIPCPYHFPATI
jgi:hypothetical protein